MTGDRGEHGEGPADAAQEGIEHLQAAVHEMIKAARSMLDAAEALVDEPRAAEALGAVMATFGRMVGSSAANWLRHDDADDEESSGVQRISVS